jgi:hypothetical protein
MPRECWLRTNVRATSLGFVVPGLLAAAGVVLIVLLPGAAGAGVWRWVGAALLLASAAMTAAVVYMLRLPRLAYEAGQLLIYLRGTAPLRVPVELVECFFLGNAPSMMPGARSSESKATSIVVRLAERAKDWESRDVNPALGQWQCGYITIRGTWCEPISRETMQRLNDRLIAAHRAARQAAEESVA